MPPRNRAAPSANNNEQQSGGGASIRLGAQAPSRFLFEIHGATGPTGAPHRATSAFNPGMGASGCFRNRIFSADSTAPHPIRAVASLCAERQVSLRERSRSCHAPCRHEIPIRPGRKSRRSLMLATEPTLQIGYAAAADIAKKAHADGTTLRVPRARSAAKASTAGCGRRTWSDDAGTALFMGARCSTLLQAFSRWFPTTRFLLRGDQAPDP